MQLAEGGGFFNTSSATLSNFKSRKIEFKNYRKLLLTLPIIPYILIGLKNSHIHCDYMECLNYNSVP